MNETQQKIIEVCEEIKSLLIEKNRKYGDSALNPARIFSQADVVEQLKVRIDDKLSRLRNAQNDEDEDVELDLIGYLILLRVAKLKDKDASKEKVVYQTGGIVQTKDIPGWPRTTTNRFENIR